MLTVALLSFLKPFRCIYIVEILQDISIKNSATSSQLKPSFPAFPQQMALEVWEVQLLFFVGFFSRFLYFSPSHYFKCVRHTWQP